MTPLLLIANRVMYGLLALVAASLLALPAIRWLAPTQTVEPVAVAAVVPAKITFETRPGPPTRNVFVADGKSWQAPPPEPSVAARPAAAVPGTSGVNGVVQIEDLRGVFAGKGFVKVGDPLNNGTLRDVGDGTYVLQSADGISTIPLDAGRKERIDTLLKAPPPKAPPPVPGKH
jgi:hypothetical protein